MNKIVMALVSGLLACAVFAGEPEKEGVPPELLANQRAKANELVSAKDDTVVMTVSGMYCPSCAATVEDEVKSLAFVRGDAVEVDVERALLVVKLKEPGVVDRAAMVKAVRQAGYQPLRFYRYADGKAQEQMIEPQKS